MQYFYLVTSAFLVAVSVIQVAGFPSSTSERRARLTRALSDIRRDALSGTLNLNEDTFVSVSDSLRRLIVAQSQGVINYETAITFLEKSLAALPQAAKAMQAIAYVIMKIKELQDKGETFFVDALLLRGLTHYCRYSEAEARRRLGSVAPLIYQATYDYESAPQQIVDHVKSQYADFQNLNGKNTELQFQILHSAMDGTVTYASVMQLTTSLD